MGTQLPLPKEGGAPNFWPMSDVAKWLHGLRRPLIWRYALAQATVLDGDPASALGPIPKKGGGAPNFRQMSTVAKRLDGSSYIQPKVAVMNS